MGTVTLTEFLLARIAEDEQVARAASPAPWQFGTVESVAGGTLYDATRTIAGLTYEQRGDHDGSIVRHLLSDEANANGEHIARHDPARVLAECEAKRRIIELHEHVKVRPDPVTEVDFGCWRCHYDRDYGVLAEGWCDTVRALALPYADHPDYQEAWRV